MDKMTVRQRLNRFFFPERTAPLWLRLLPYAAIFAVGVILFLIAGAGWEYTNSSEFCGTACHTMPPEYISYQQSPHARVKCVECHIGRGYIATQFGRKAGDAAHILRYIGADYEVPIYVKNMRTSQQICEKCHNPEKYSDTTLHTVKRFDENDNNRETATYLALKTGGGSYKDGLGSGIHWHIENKVEYIAVDSPNLRQQIPWVRVTFADTGQTEEFVDITAALPVDFQNTRQIQTMDCMTCHNRIAHPFPNPADALDDMMARGVVSPEIPYIKRNALAVIVRQYPSMEEAAKAINGLRDYYDENWHNYYTKNTEIVDRAVKALLAAYERMVFPTMDITWDTHPDNAQHKDSAGCFRCHDGKHLNAEQQAIPANCDLCHAAPLQNLPDGSVPPLPVLDEFQPESHTDSHWLARHRFNFDDTCDGCHTVSDPGGISGESFCANSGCHATEWKYLGIDAPEIVALSNVLTLDDPSAPLTWDGRISAIMAARCVVCHGDGGGLNLETYASAMAGGNSGAAIVPGSADESLLVTIQPYHPNRLPPDAWQWLADWINNGAPEN